MKEPITQKQKEILTYIRGEIRKKGYPPSVREICSAVGLRSTSSVHSHLESLEAAGYIHRDSSKTRAIELLDEPEEFSAEELASLPILGRVAAGMPLLATENIEGYFPIPVSMLPNQELFILKVQGESMVEAGIFDGDMVIVARTNVASDGEIVVALIDDSATVKRFYKEKGVYRLQPENSAMDPIYTREVMILGKVIGLLRMGIH